MHISLHTLRFGDEQPTNFELRQSHSDIVPTEAGHHRRLSQLIDLLSSMVNDVAPC